MKGGWEEESEGEEEGRGRRRGRGSQTRQDQAQACGMLSVTYCCCHYLFYCLPSDNTLPR